MKRLLFALLTGLMLAGPVFAAAPTIEESQRLQFTAADQETTATFRIDYIVWASFTGSVIVDTNVLNLEDGAGTEIFKMAVDGLTATPVVIPMNGLIVTGLKAEDLTKGYVTVYGQRR